MKRFLFLSGLLLAALPLPRALAANLIVDPSGAAGTYPTLQAAVDAAQDGDLILVRPGDYRLAQTLSTAISGRSLTIVADPPGSTAITTGIRVVGVAAPGRVVVRGLQLLPGILPVSPGTEVVQSSGGAWFEDCTIAGIPGSGTFFQTFPGEPGIRADASPLTVVRCQVSGGPGAVGTFTVPASAGGPGIRLENGAVLALHDSSSGGGTGGSGTFPGNGGAGMEVLASRVLLSGGAVSGGAPGGGAAQGGAGLQADVSSSVSLLQATLAGGSGAPALQAPPGVVQYLPGLARSIEVTSPVTPGAPAALVVSGEVGDLALFLWSPRMAHLSAGAISGWLLLGAPLFGPVLLGPLPPPDGDLTINFLAAPLVPPTVGRTDLAQAIFLGLDGVLVAGAPTAFTRRI